MSPSSDTLDLLPLCDGAPLGEVPGSPDRIQMMRAFAEVYREINSCARRLRHVRAAAQLNAADERAALQAMERALVIRDALDDEHAQRGVIAVPVVKDGFVRDIQFTTPSPADEESSVISMCFSVMPLSFYQNNPPEDVCKES